MKSRDIEICRYTSDDPRGQFLDVMRFMKNELRGIEAIARERHHRCTVKMVGETIELLNKMWSKAIHECDDPMERHSDEKEAHKPGDFSDYVLFKMMVKKHWVR